MNRKQFLLDLRKYGLENTVPNITDVNAKFLVDLINISKTKNMLEIGTANGFSGINFAIELEKNDGHLTTIDFSPKSHNEALENFKIAKVDNLITAILGNALDEIPKLQDDFFDFIFIDGMKKRSGEFLELCLPKAKSGAIIIIDDVLKFKDKMSTLRTYLEKNQVQYNILPIDPDDGILMIIKK
ncbi:MAG: class I SAM-dependent methyltransferase [Candidatus Gracilibacteria bacterium]|nr:class I SAM-dependent methyltransferase [Candidatus Gracilibacteria bacterium]